MNKTEAIKSFLESNTHPDLASLYRADMECQVNVAQGNGERIKGEYKGKQWSGFTDNTGQVWKSFRIPYNANTEPTYEDKPMRFSLEEHAEGIGMTGWNWLSKQSHWVAYDFDAIIGHSEKHPTKLTSEELEAVKNAASELPWTTVRKSTSGKGLHIYVELVNALTANHTEHAALARSILHYMSAVTGFPFDTQVDICGGNMWVWHRKMKGTDGLSLIKQGVPLEKIPTNWRDHLHVVSGKRRRVLPEFAGESFDDLSSQTQHNPLDESHKALVKFLDDSGASFWWDDDHHMLVCHTYDLKQAHAALNCRGIFDTVAEGTRQGVDHNCFMYPLRDGAWVVRRYGDGTDEADTWSNDGKGYTRCYFNKKPDLKTACKGFGGVEHPSGGFVFSDASVAIKVAKSLDVKIDIPERYQSRETKLKQHKDGRLIIHLKRESSDDTADFRGWLCEKPKEFIKICDEHVEENTVIDVGNYDDFLRHVVSETGVSLGWVLKSEKQWTDEPVTHVSTALRAMGLKPVEVQTVLGNNILKPWQLVNKPFEPEYIGDRCWNRDGAQFRYPPALDKDKYHTPTWDGILQHVGQGLDEYIVENPWCKENLLLTGADYLRCWVASLLQAPYEPLPYLFLWSSEQNTGKSIFHEALNILFTRGYVRADHALQGSFNGELESAILCVVEETDLQRNKKAYNMIKDYVTGLHISLHVKGSTPVMIRNTTHWIQCANEPTACPLFKGDTRVTVINVPPLKAMTPKRDLVTSLRKEAPDFLASVLKLELPYTADRLNIPVIETNDKRIIARTNENLLELFIDERCHKTPGYSVTIADFYEAFNTWLDPSERYMWSKRAVSKNMHPSIVKGRDHKGSWAYGNLTFQPDLEPRIPFVLSPKGESLVRKQD